MKNKINAELDLDTVECLEIGNLPSLVTQKAMVEEIERLKTEGKSSEEACKLVFENNDLKNMPH